MLIDKIVSILSKEANFEIGSDNYLFVSWGLKTIINFIVKTTLLIIFACLLGIFNEIVFYFIVLFVLRRVAFGTHLKNNFLCATVGFLYFFGGIFLAKTFILNNIVVNLIYLLCFVLNLFYAPAPSKDRLLGRIQTKQHKILTLCILVILFIFLNMIKDNIYKNIIFIAVIIETITILPFERLEKKL